MNFKTKVSRLLRAVRNTFHSYFIVLFQFPRKIKFWLLSTCNEVKGSPIVNQPVLLNGNGSIIFNGTVRLGVPESADFHSGYIYLDARREVSKIIFDDGVWVNNNLTVICEGNSIRVGKNSLIGTNVTIYDSDFHELHPAKRLGGKPSSGEVSIGENVFIGSDVTVLKGVVIGSNSVIANGSIVTKSVPANVIAGGIPCRVLKKLSEI